MRSLRNVTITLDEDTAHWARVQAAHRHTSVSRFIGELLRARMRQDEDYETARHAYLRQELRPLSRPHDTYPPRDELHDRPAVR
ncbi:MAG: hypothetical protein J2P40_12095 [Candidatus Dormibacteraeota bacterium]|nr:hypothetical protein [Candidatus Dormibacteraeota bacterium]MBO0762007.1 hypothetical protein [Candidatus Dormibacteraeota bacterium]